MRKTFLAFISFILLSVSFAYSQKTSVENLNQYHLENGLTLFTLENHNVPLTYIDISFKTGTSAQTAETAGFFQLYDYLVLLGNPLCPDYNSMQEYISDMGASNLNSDIKSDCIYYSITVPSREKERALAFLNAAVRQSGLTKERLDLVKSLYLDNIQTFEDQQSSIYNSYQISKLFPNAPYRADSLGSKKAVENASVELMEDFLSKNFIPSKAAIFVGGDIDSNEIYKLVKKIFGNWEENKSTKEDQKIQQEKEPFNQVKKAVYPFKDASRHIAQIKIQFRGPDTDVDLESTYAADYLCYLMRNPEGPFKKNLLANSSLGIPDAGYISGNYATKRSDGVIEFTVYVANPEKNLPQRVDALLSDIQDKILPSIANDSNLYKKNTVKSVAQYLKNTDSIVAETPEGLLTNLRFWWASTNSDYYFSYNKKMSSVKQDDMKNFINKYITDKKPLVSVVLNPDLYKEKKAEYEKAGYEEIKKDTALWQNNEKYAPDKQALSEMNGKVKRTKLYLPSEVKKEDESDKSESVKKYTLKNGIPVYVKNGGSGQMDSIYIAVSGGVSYLSEDTSGLTDALLTMMGRSSINYPKNIRQKLSYQYMAPIKYKAETEGSALYVSVLDSYWKKVLPLLTDSFINPDFNKDIYESVIKEYKIALDSWTLTAENKLNIDVYKELYKDHPYLPLNTPTELSIDNITIENLKDLHKKFINPENIFVVATGKINGKALVKELNKSLGKLEKSESQEKNIKEIPLIDMEEESKKSPMILTSPDAKNNATVVRVFTSPSITHEDYIAAQVASSIYTDILNKITVSRYKAADQAFSSILSSHAPVGQEYFKSVSDLENFSAAAEEARALMAGGKVIKSLQGENSYNYTELSTKLESCKNKFITATYYSQQKAADQGWALESMILEFNDPEYSTKLMKKIKVLSADEILEVFKKYWIEAPSRWYAIVSDDEKSLIRF